MKDEFKSFLEKSKARAYEAFNNAKTDEEINTYKTEMDNIDKLAKGIDALDAEVENLKSENSKLTERCKDIILHSSYSGDKNIENNVISQPKSLEEIVASVIAKRK